MIMPPEALLRRAAGALFLLIAIVALRDGRQVPLGR